MESVEKKEIVALKQRMLHFAEMVQAYLDHPKMLKNLRRCIGIETKLVKSEEFLVSPAEKDNLLLDLGTLSKITKKLSNGRKFTEFKIYEKQLDNFADEIRGYIEEVLPTVAAAARKTVDDESSETVKKNEKNLT